MESKKLDGQDKSYLRFSLRADNGRTKTWSVNNLEGISLGVVTFRPQWRKYVYMPGIQTVLDASCLLEIANFCFTESTAWRTGLASRKHTKHQTGAKAGP